MKYIPVAVVLAVGLVNSAVAADPTGTWKWTTAQNDQCTLKLQLDSEGPTLTGSYTGGERQVFIPIAEARYNSEVGAISFAITREINGKKSTIKYLGSLQGDAITGKTQTELGGQIQSSDWLAKRYR